MGAHHSLIPGSSSTALACQSHPLPRPSDRTTPLGLYWNSLPLQQLPLRPGLQQHPSIQFVLEFWGAPMLGSPCTCWDGGEAAVGDDDGLWLLREGEREREKERERGKQEHTHSEGEGGREGERERERERERRSGDAVEDDSWLRPVVAARLRGGARGLPAQWRGLQPAEYGAHTTQCSCCSPAQRRRRARACVWRAMKGRCLHSTQPTGTIVPIGPSGAWGQIAINPCVPLTTCPGVIGGTLCCLTSAGPPASVFGCGAQERPGFSCACLLSACPGRVPRADPSV